LITRPVNVSPRWARARQCRAAKWVISHVPRTCTRMTASKSSALMFQMTLSRAMPALFTRMSSLPNSATARSTSAALARDQRPASASG
jgi:hypothetical protein